MDKYTDPYTGEPESVLKRMRRLEGALGFFLQRAEEVRAEVVSEKKDPIEAWAVIDQVIERGRQELGLPPEEMPQGHDLRYEITEQWDGYHVRFKSTRGSRFEAGPFKSWIAARMAGRAQVLSWEKAPRGFQVGD